MITKSKILIVRDFPHLLLLLYQQEHFSVVRDLETEKLSGHSDSKIF